MVKEHYDITIIGGGLAGLSLSILLAKQNHAVLLLPTTKNIQNVHLKGLNIKNVRGDAVCIGNTRFFCENIVVENLTAQNIYRNGVSITSGRGIQLTNIDVQQSGMDGIDIEGEGTPDMPLENLTITNAFIGNLCVTGITQKAKNIRTRGGGCAGEQGRYTDRLDRTPCLCRAHPNRQCDVQRGRDREYCDHSTDPSRVSGVRQCFLTRTEVQSLELSETRHNRAAKKCASK